MPIYTLPNGKKITLDVSQDSKFGRDGYKKLRVSAKHRDIPFNIKSVEELIMYWINTPDVCYWCLQDEHHIHQLYTNILDSHKTSLTLNKLKNLIRTHNNRFLTYDRLDSNKDYCVNNLVKSCLICNTARGFLITEDEYEQIAFKVIDYIKNLLK